MDTSSLIFGVSLDVGSELSWDARTPVRKWHYGFVFGEEGGRSSGKDNAYCVYIDGCIKMQS